MTAIDLAQTATLAIDQAIGFIISNNEIDKAILKLNEAKICTEQMERIINPPDPPIPTTTLRREICQFFSIPEELIFTRSRKREIVSSRQVYVYVMMSLSLGNGSTAMMKHIGWDHATHLSSRKTIQGYYDQGSMGIKREIPLKNLIDRLIQGIKDGIIEEPNIKEHVGL